MSAGPANEAIEGTAYTFRPSVLGASWEFRLTGDGIVWRAGRRSGLTSYRDVRRLRMSFKPANTQWHRFLTEVWADGTPKLKIVSSSWRGPLEQERLDQSYSAFIVELHRRIALAAPQARFEQGSHPLLYWPGLIVFVAIALAAAALIEWALQADAKSAAAFVGVFLALCLWQGGNFFRRNRPGVYRPEAPPTELLPKG